MTDLTDDGLRRTNLALSIVRECDFEATGQLPATHKPKPGLAARAAKATGKAAGKGCLYGAKYVGKGAWGVTKYVFTPRSSRRSIHITIIEKDSACDGWCRAAAVVVFIILALAAVGSA